MPPVFKSPALAPSPAPLPMASAAPAPAPSAAPPSPSPAAAEIAAQRTDARQTLQQGLDALLEKSKSVQVANSLAETERIQTATRFYVGLLVNPKGVSSGDLSNVMADLKLSPEEIRRHHAQVHSFLAARENARDMPTLRETHKAALAVRDTAAKTLEAAEAEVRRAYGHLHAASSDLRTVSLHATEYPRFFVRDPSYPAGVRLVSEPEGGGGVAGHPA